jgi:hypothetical protein
MKRRVLWSRYLSDGTLLQVVEDEGRKLIELLSDDAILGTDSTGAVGVRFAPSFDDASQLIGALQEVTPNLTIDEAALERGGWKKL